MRMNHIKQILKLNELLFDFLTWFLLIGFLIFIFMIGFNVSLNTDDLYLLNLFKSHTLLASFEEFPHNFRIGSYSLYFFIFRDASPSNIQFYLGFYFLSIFLFSVLIMQFALKKYQGFLNSSQLTFMERIKVSLYFLCFSFYFSETLGETWFWSNAILTYFLPFYIAIGLSVFFFEKQRPVKNALIIGIGNFYIGGSSESFALTWFVIQFFMLFAADLERKQKFQRIPVIFVTLLPIFLNLLTSKINNRLQFETKNNHFRLDLLADLRGFYMHFDRMDFLALLILILLFIELRVKNWHFGFSISYHRWWMILLASFLISYSLNIFVFQGMGPLRIFSNVNQLTGLFLIIGIFHLAKGRSLMLMKGYSLIFPILSIPFFFNYFFGQIEMTTRHKMAYTKRLELLKSVTSSAAIVPVKKLPDAGITVFCDVSKSSEAFSNIQFKMYYEINCKFYKSSPDEPDK
jgi:hypothetical protein